jgi:hypothetical protein
MSPQVWDLVRTVAGILLAGILGFASGVWTGQIGYRRQQRDKVTGLRTALYTELGDLYSALSILSTHATTEKEREDFRNMLHVIRLDAYEYARANPDLFYTLDESSELQHLFSAVDFAKNHPGRPHDLALAMAFPYAVQSAVKDNRIDVLEFGKRAPQAFHTLKVKLNLA